MSRTLFSLAGFQVIISGRFWVIAEGHGTGVVSIRGAYFRVEISEQGHTDALIQGRRISFGIEEHQEGRNPKAASPQSYRSLGLRSVCHIRALGNVGVGYQLGNLGNKLIADEMERCQDPTS